MTILITDKKISAENEYIISNIEIDEEDNSQLKITRKNLYNNDSDTIYVEVGSGSLGDSETVVTNVCLSLAEKFNIVNGELIYTSLNGHIFSINEDGELIYTSDEENPYFIHNNDLYTSEPGSGPMINVTKVNLATHEVIEDFIPYLSGEGDANTIMLVLDELINLFDDNGE